MFCPDSMVPRWLSGRSSAIRYRSILMGTESCRGGLGEGHVRRGLFPRGWNRDNTEHARVSVLKVICLFWPWVTLFMPCSNNFVLIRAISYYKRAAELGDKRAAQRLRGPQSQPVHQPGGPGAVLHRGSGDDTSKGGKDKDCLIM